MQTLINDDEIPSVKRNKLRTSGYGGNNFTLNRETMTEIELNRLADDYSKWLASEFGFAPAEAKEAEAEEPIKSLCKFLESGEVLCNVLNKIDASLGLTPKGVSGLSEAASAAVYRENVQAFVQGCDKLGVANAQDAAEALHDHNGRGLIPCLNQVREKYEAVKRARLELAAKQAEASAKAAAAGPSSSDQGRSFKWLFITAAAAASLVAFELLRKSK